MNYYLHVLKEKYADFNGRARRAEFWQFVLFNFIISFVLGLIDGMLFGYRAISALYSLAVLVPGIAVGVRRMHDIGKSGWFIIIPFYNIYLATLEGNKGPNEYGPDPKGAVNETTATPFV